MCEGFGDKCVSVRLACLRLCQRGERGFGGVDVRCVCVSNLALSSGEESVRRALLQSRALHVSLVLYSGRGKPKVHHLS